MQNDFKDKLTDAVKEVLAPDAEWGCCRVFNGKAEIFSSLDDPRLETIHLIMMAIFNTAEVLEMDPINLIRELQKMFEDEKKALPQLQ